MKRFIAGALILSAAELAAGTVVVTTTNDSGPGSFRQAILDANSGVCQSPCTIKFQIPNVPFWGYHVIQLQSHLPAILANNTKIDATTQMLFTGNTNPSGPEVAIDCNGLLNQCIQIAASWVSVRGLAIGKYNYACGIRIGGSPAVSGTHIAGNFIGIEATGTSAWTPSFGSGVCIENAKSVLIGGVTSFDRNVISGQTRAAVAFGSAAGAGSAVRGNYIGTNAAGTAVITNDMGITAVGGEGIAVGGSGPGAGNLISDDYPVYISATKSRSVITGNVIGVAANGTTPLPISGFGVWVNGGPVDIIRNMIAHAADGITIENNTRTNIIRENSIFNNRFMGIDLGRNSKPDPNDAGDADTGANDLQNTPALKSALLSGTTLAVNFSVDSSAVVATNAIVVEFFKADSSTNRQGQTFIGASCGHGNALSNVTVTFPNAPVAIGDEIVATATSYKGVFCYGPNDGTSEFSPALVVTTPPPPPPSTINTANPPENPCYFAAKGVKILCLGPLEWMPIGQPCAPEAQPCAPQVPPLCRLLDCTPCLRDNSCQSGSAFEVLIDNTTHDLQFLIVDDFGREVGLMEPLREPVVIGRQNFNQSIRFHAEPATEYRLQAYPGPLTPMSCVQDAALMLRAIE